MKEKTIDTCLNEFISKLTFKLLEENIDSQKIKEYTDACEKAKNYCIDQFSAEFGRFGGQFTSHGPDHAARVLDFSLQLSERLNPPINATEYFFLGIAALLHDIGMTAPLPSDFAEKVLDEDQRWIERRKRHGEATAEIITRNHNHNLQIISKPQQDIYFEFLPHICAAHCTSGFIKHITKIKKLKNQHRNYDRFEIIAGLLLLADELDISCIRARPDINKYNEFKSNITKAHWWKHWLVSDISINGNIIYISCLTENKFQWADEFTLWTKVKLDSQISILKENLDQNVNNNIWDLEVKVVPINKVWWQQSLPQLITTKIVEVAQAERLSIQGQKLTRIIEPTKLIEGIRNNDAIIQPSTFFRNVIARRITHFRGQGQYVQLEDARKLYVEEERNINLLNHAIAEWKDYITNKNEGVNLKMFVGDIGVGKTHFLSSFLHDIKEKHSALYSNVIVARAEFTECERDNILSIQKEVAISLYKDMSRRLDIVNSIRDIMQHDYSVDTTIPIPVHVEEIESWDVKKINRLIRVIGKICLPDSEINKLLGEKAPTSFCIFCDNSDQLKKEVIGDLYEWANNISGSANCLVWLFLRPDTLAYLENIYQRAPFGLRGAEPIYAPSLKEVVMKRIDIFPNRFKKNEEIEVPFGNGKISPVDIQKSIRYIVNLTMENSDDILPKLTDRLEGDGQANLRAGLQALLRILGSHIISDEEYAKALMLQNVISSQTKEERKIKPIFERWPKILEALILGRRVWYSPNSGAIENLFDPPEIESYGDYFIIIHCLQLLKKNNRKEYQFHELVSSLGHVGYKRGRIQGIIKHLASRIHIVDEKSIHEDPFLKRTFPLVEVKLPSLEHSFKDNTIIQITPWGEYHLKTLIIQAQYWKHIYYQIAFPASLAKNMDTKAAKGFVSSVVEQLTTVFNYLSKIEDSYFYGFDEEDFEKTGIELVIKNIRKRILNQLDISKN